MDLAELQRAAAQGPESQTALRIHCCTSTGCQSVNSAAVHKSLQEALVAAGMGEQARVVGVGCMGLCGHGPLVEVVPTGMLYERVTPEQAPSIVATLQNGRADAYALDRDQPFFARQFKIACEYSGQIDPERIEDYIAVGGYSTLHYVLHEMTPNEVVQAMTSSGLRGRGGAGYPTGVKWGTVAKAAGDRKFVVCNGDEGDPGAFMDRNVLESDPHRILEGMAIAGYAVGAEQGYIYIRGEYPLAIHRLQRAIQHAKRLGVIGAQIFDTGFDFRVDLRIGAGAFVCGEETALIASLEGQRGMPRPRPPYPAESGIWGAPTLINNVETFACVVPIIREGPEWFAGIGTAGSTGTKVFALTGNIYNTGLIEVPMGTTLRTITAEMGGGAPGGRSVKAVQTGGPSGGCIPASLFDTPVDFESLARIGSIMGSGGLVVMDDETSMVDVAHFYMEFCKDESCGKCIPCRVGTVQMHHLLGRIRDGVATQADLRQLQDLCTMVKQTSLCGLGQSAPNPVLSTLRYFPEEYDQLLQK